ncbi:nucleoside diphosphate kinase homolog 5 [Tribolium castaneum]|uniref:Nucleoside diphosphate kinase homolog 5 n=1 Tax=Tribolium castaneum TaxID=7070 RepID=D6WA76_TRICA|nr:PREDICTED: nucleoside diphosphate kinase homolog 5 [Tribolium castaneum]EEZ98594.1 Nucleoside diphosphate kinase homolog 5-like Protein [Tribolium castaneum]|eukprot:XP_001811234.1 PREDICTED: nucleoside diphosphate kinase homolog 5 [Tribolium castaneum]
MDQDKHQGNTSPTTSDSSLRLPTKAASNATDDAWANQDTIHYLSPVTTARTLCEGDFDYGAFAPFYGKMSLPPYSTESSLSCEEARLQRTVAIIKPEAMVYKDVVLKAIADKGFSIVNQRTLHLTPEQVAEIYEQHYGCPSFPNMVVSMSLGPCLVLSLAGMNSIEKWKSLVGPYKTLQAEWFLPLSVRKRFEVHVDIPDALHASENAKEATRENRYFYPDSILEPIICDQYKVEDYCNLYINPTLLKGLVELVRKKPVDPIIFLAEWLLMNNPFQPQVPYKYATAPT